MSDTVAVVPAAGSGERLGAGMPKAFVELGGRTMLEHAVDGLLASGVIDRVVVAAPADRVDETAALLGGSCHRGRRAVASATRVFGVLWRPSAIRSSSSFTTPPAR